LGYIVRITVDSYSGYRACERPLRFRIGEKWRDVVEILDRWYGEDHDYVKVLADDGGMYVLRYGRGDDRWELTQYRAGGTGPSELKAGEASSRDSVH
jgi:hypothetical protein